MVDILIFAIIAIAIALRLYKTLGQTSEEQFSEKEQFEKVVELAKKDFKEVVSEVSIDEMDKMILKNLSKTNLQTYEKIRRINKSFSVEKFVKNSEKAFQAIIKAFSDSNHKVIKQLSGEKVQETFLTEIASLKKSKQNIKIDLVSIVKTEIQKISLSKDNIVSISVSYISEQITAIMDKDENVVSGDAKKIEEIEDNWVFEKDITSSNPVWKLTQIGS
jgi:predicted lipid-binding transport protein (Tim44 family)